MKRSYTAQEKARALRIYEEHGLAECARRTGIPKRTLADWTRHFGVHTKRPAKTERMLQIKQMDFLARRVLLREQLLNRVLELEQRMDEPHEEFKGNIAKPVHYKRAPADAVRNYAVSMGILLDKLRLELGEVTTRGESTTVEHSKLDAEIEKLLGELRERDKIDERDSVPA